MIVQAPEHHEPGARVLKEAAHAAAAGARQRGLEELVASRRARRTVIMCAEALPWRCHRSLVADALCVRGIPVVEILSTTAHRDHKLTPFAHVDGGRITYPPGQPTLL